EREPGNLETLSFDAVEAVVSSPPYEAEGVGHGYRGDPSKSWGIRPEHPVANYGKTEGQLGSGTGETFWTAAHQVVQETFALLKPGGYAVWVVKAFVRDKKLVDFPGDWRKLC